MKLHTTQISGSVTISGSIIPQSNLAFDLGSAANNWRHLYVGSGSIYMGGNKILGLNTDGSIQLGLQTVQTSASLATYVATGGTATNAFTGAVYVSGTLNVSNNLIVTGSVTASSLSGSLTGSLFGNATNITQYTINQNVGTGNTPTFAGLIVQGNLTAQQYIISSSVTYLTESFASGSHKFGDTIDDYHDFTGSLRVTGSANINGNTLVTGSLTTTGTINGLSIPNDLFAQQFLLMGA